MTCSVYTPCPASSRMTLREAKAIAGMGCEFPADRYRPKTLSIAQWERKQADEKAIWDAAHDAPLPTFDGHIFIHGDLDVAVCACGHSADFLCDYPIGKGKTCDLALCGCCRESIGEERDLCRIHAAQFRGAPSVVQKFSKPALVGAVGKRGGK